MDNISLDRFISKKVIKINNMHPILIFDGEESLTIECPWRLKNRNTIILGSGEHKAKETHKKANDKLKNLLIGQEVNDIRITSSVSDLNIEFSNYVLLELFNDSSIYEGWTLSDGKDFILVSLPGGEVSLLEK